MNKKTWLLIAIVSAIWICLFPVVILAESVLNYTTISANTYYIFASSEQGNCRRYSYTVSGRAVAYHNSQDANSVFIGFMTDNGSCSQHEMRASSSSSSTAWLKPENSTQYYQSLNVTSYYTNNNNERFYYNFIRIPTNSSNNPIYIGQGINDIGTFNGTISEEMLYEYTYGDSSEVITTNWGLLRDTSYTTRIAGSGQAARQNIDYIKWEKSIDTNGNDISECEIEVQAVYGKFTGNTLIDLWETDLQDFAILGSVSLGVLPANKGEYSVTWTKVIEDLNSFDFDMLIAHEVNQQIEKNGWYYQIRLLGSDGYIGEWQTIYTPLSIGAKASETVINNNNFDMSVYQVYQDLSTINNNTSITITYIDTDYTINNPNDGTEPEGGTNLWDVLKELISGIFQILAKLGDLVGNLIDGLMGIFQNLFTPSEVDQEINNNINVEVNTYLQESQPGLNDIHNNIDTWKLQLEDIASNYANGGDCIITWEDVTIDLSAFNAGTVTFIPGGTYDLKTAFISLLTAFGFSYSTYEMIVSAIIYISLIVLISHKVKGFLKT